MTPAQLESAGPSVGRDLRITGVTSTAPCPGRARFTLLDFGIYSGYPHSPVGGQSQEERHAEDDLDH